MRIQKKISNNPDETISVIFESVENFQIRKFLFLLYLDILKNIIKLKVGILELIIKEKII